jgi:peptidoglycan/LPS O-acetylase OafA/YrhL
LEITKGEKRLLEMQDNPIPVPDHKIWIPEIDYMRGMAIIAVVAMHCFPPTPDWYPGLTFNWLNVDVPTINGFILTATSFASPAFMFISGFVLSLNYPANALKESSFITKRLRYLLPPYFIFSLITIAGFGIFDRLPSFNKIAFDLIFANASGPLWFFAIIVQLYLLYPWIIKIYGRFAKNGRLVFLFLVLLSINWIWWAIFGYLRDLSNSEYLSIVLSRVVLPYLLFFIAGIGISQNFSKISQTLSRWHLTGILVVVLLLVVLLQLVKNHRIETAVTIIAAPVYIFVVFILFFKIAMNLKNITGVAHRLLQNIGRYSFGIYLVHPLILFGLTISLFRTGTLSYDNWLVFVLIFLLTLSLSFVVVSIVRYLPFSRLIIGIH